MDSNHLDPITNTATVAIDLQRNLGKIASGKVRDLFEVDKERLLFVSSDRISAFDIVMKNVTLDQLSSQQLPWPGGISVSIEGNWPGFAVDGESFGPV